MWRPASRCARERTNETSVEGWLEARKIRRTGGIGLGGGNNNERCSTAPRLRGPRRVAVAPRGVSVAASNDAPGGLLNRLASLTLSRARPRPRRFNHPQAPSRRSRRQEEGTPRKRIFTENSSLDLAPIRVPVHIVCVVIRCIRCGFNAPLSRCCQLALGWNKRVT